MTMHHHFQSKRTKSFYAGRVLDGPHEGDWFESDESVIMKYLQRRIGAAFDPLRSPSIEVDRAYYIWLRSYRAWAYVQQHG